MSTNFTDELTDLSHKNTFTAVLNDAIDYRNCSTYTDLCTAEQLAAKQSRIRHVSRIIKNHFNESDHTKIDVNVPTLNLNLSDMDQTDIDELKTCCENCGYTFVDTNKIITISHV